MKNAVEFEVGTYNLGVAAVTHHPDAVVKDIGELFKTVDVLVCQEGGQAHGVLERAAKQFDLEVFDGLGKPGQDATPILYRKSLKVKAKKSLLLTRPTRVPDSAAGPSTTKTKWLNVIKVKFKGRSFWVANIHCTPSVYLDPNERLVREQIRDAAVYLKRFRGIKILGGDFNTLPSDDLRNPLEAHMRSAQIALGAKDTKDNRNIDDVYFSVGLKYFKAASSRLFKGASDHHGFVVTFNVVPTAAARAVDRMRAWFN